MNEAHNEAALLKCHEIIAGGWKSLGNFVTMDGEGTLGEEVARALKAAHGDADVNAQDDDRLCRAFLEGAKWWEWRQTEATMGSADQHTAMDEAEARLARGTLGTNEEEFLATLRTRTINQETKS